MAAFRDPGSVGRTGLTGLLGLLAVVVQALSTSASNTMEGQGEDVTGASPCGRRGAIARPPRWTTKGDHERGVERRAHRKRAESACDDPRSQSLIGA